MKRSAVIALVVLYALLPVSAFAGDWDFKKNLKRLERVSPDYEADKDIDTKFLDVLDLIEKTKQGADVYAEAKRVAGNAALGQSKYMDSFLYYMFVKSLGQYRTGTVELDYWLGLLKTNNEKSPHLLAAQLIRLRQLPKDSPTSGAILSSS